MLVKIHKIDILLCFCFQIFKDKKISIKFVNLCDLSVIFDVYMAQTNLRQTIWSGLLLLSGKRGEFSGLILIFFKIVTYLQLNTVIYGNYRLTK